MECASSASFNDFCSCSATCGAATTGITILNIEGIIRNSYLLNLVRLSGIGCFNARGRHGAVRLVLFPGGALALGHVDRKLLLEFVVHPLDAGQSAISILTLRWTFAEVPELTEEILRCLT